MTKGKVRPADQLNGLRAAGGESASCGVNVRENDEYRRAVQDADALDALEINAGAEVNPQQVLSAGVRDVTETLTSDFALNDVLQMVLEPCNAAWDSVA